MSELSREMMAKTTIEWTATPMSDGTLSPGYTFNPWWGCTKVSAGCKNCYAETLANRFGKNIWGVNGERRFFGDKHWNEPLKWNRKAKKLGVRYKVFCGSMCDVFERYSSPQTIAGSQQAHIAADLQKARLRLGKLIKATPCLDWLLLTKRPENISLLASVFGWVGKGFLYGSWKIPNNVWIGTSVENQEQADKRILELLKIPARVRFLSCEPLLENINLGLLGTIPKDISPTYSLVANQIHWVIVGGESGPRKRSFNPDWARVLRDECQEANVPYFFKQVDKVQPIPDDLMIREFPIGE